MPDACAMPASGIADDFTHDLSSHVWRNRLAAYAEPDARRAAFQLGNTLLLFLAGMSALLYGLNHGYWLAGILALPVSLLVVRLFIIQHDCGHDSFFRSRRANKTFGLAISVMTLMPFTFWRKAHAMHHATAGHLDRRGTGDIRTLTVAEYRAKSTWKKVVYRLYRHPVVLFGLGPAFLLLIYYRLPIRTLIRDRHSRASILGTNAAATIAITGIALLVGPIVFLIAWSAVLLLATSIGMWFFSVQHQFEDTYWERSPKWDFHAAALEGSSFYDLPRFLHWFTGSIGLHHIHHLASKIPNYRLRACFDQNPELQRAKRLTMWASIKSVRLALWDEEQQKLVSFRQAAALCA